MGRLRLQPVHVLYQGWEIQEKKWWGWKKLARFYSRQEAEAEYRALMKERGDD